MTSQADAVNLLNRCRTLDIRLWAEDGRLRYDAPPDALDAGLRAEIAAHKAALLDALATATPVVAYDTTPPADDRPAPVSRPTLTDRPIHRAHQEGGTWTDPRFADVDWDTDIRDLIVP